MSAAVHPAAGKEIAVREGIDNCYVSRRVDLTKPALDIVAAILDDALPNTVRCSIWQVMRGRCGMSSARE